MHKKSSGELYICNNNIKLNQSLISALWCCGHQLAIGFNLLPNLSWTFKALRVDNYSKSLYPDTDAKRASIREKGYPSAGKGKYAFKFTRKHRSDSSNRTPDKSNNHSRLDTSNQDEVSESTDNDDLVKCFGVNFYDSHIFGLFHLGPRCIHISWLRRWMWRIIIVSCMDTPIIRPLNVILIW